MSRKYKFNEKMGAYFISFVTVNWIDFFTRKITKIYNLVFGFCIKNKGVILYGYFGLMIIKITI